MIERARTPSAHPTAEQLSDFARGKLPEAQAATVAEHLGQCATCLRQVQAAPPGQAAPAGRPGRGAGVGATPAVGEVPAGLRDHPRFRVLRLLGQGGMGSVYLAEHKIMRRPVALKVVSRALLDNPEALARFHNEVVAAGRLRHEHIVTAHDAERAGELHLLVMEYVEGHNLAEVVDKKGPLPVKAACRFAQQAAEGLQHAHERGMVHRDIKPHNLMLTKDGQVKILDFGLARLASEQGAGGAVTRAGAYMGTPEYMAPEQAVDARTADIRADIYSLGCTLYCLLAGRPPFAGDTPGKQFQAHQAEAARPLGEVRPEVPAALAAVVARMMAKDPAGRYQTPAEVAAALAPFAKGSPSVAARSAAPAGPAGHSPFEGLADAVSPARLRTRPARAGASSDPGARPRSSGRAGWVRSHGVLMAAAAGGAALLLLLGFFFLLRWTRPDGSKLEIAAGTTPAAGRQDGSTKDAAEGQGSGTPGKGQDPAATRKPVAGASDPSRPPPPSGRAGDFIGARYVPGGLAGRAAAVREKLALREGGSPESEAAVGRGLRWLALHQGDDGRWSLDHYRHSARDRPGPGGRKFTCDCTGGGMDNDTAGTALGVLPFLAAGITPRDSAGMPADYTRTVDNALKFLVAQQNPRNGYLGGGLYAHGLGAIALGEAYGLTSDPGLKDAAQKALDFIVAGQNDDGGWRYTPRDPSGSDTSVTSWHVAALTAGQAAGLTGPARALEAAGRWLDSCQAPDGGYGYQLRTATPTMTAAGLLCRESLGWSPRNPDLLAGVARLREHPPGSHSSIYYHYYATQVLHHLGGEPWQEWNGKMRDLLLRGQDDGEGAGGAHQKGSWSPAGDAYGPQGGRVMQTSLSLLTLQVYYRHLPLYRNPFAGGEPDAGPAGPRQE